MLHGTTLLSRGQDQALRFHYMAGMTGKQSLMVRNTEPYDSAFADGGMNAKEPHILPIGRSSSCRYSGPRAETARIAV